TAGDLSLDIADTLTNEDGEIVHAGEGEARIVATRLEGSDGLIVSQGQLSLNGGEIVLDGATTSAESLALTADHLSHRQGEMLHTGDDRDLSLTLGQSLDNTSGQIASNAGLDIIAGELTNTAGTLQALDNVRLDVGDLDNRQGDLIAGDALTLVATGYVDNTQGQWLAERIDVTAVGLNNSDGLISAASGELNVRAGELDNTHGRVETAGDLSLDIADTLTNEDGEIVHAGEGEARIVATRLEGSDG
ncbi:hypothetical protein, partial [Vreelandella olivaria]|uniref:hypothetical protein n=1 Tax=Vreelandella olivaria TaxID=390919 RepID=UPI00201EC399